MSRRAQRARERKKRLYDIHQKRGNRFTFRWKSIFNCNAYETLLTDKVLCWTVRTDTFISISNHLIHLLLIHSIAYFRRFIGVYVCERESVSCVCVFIICMRRPANFDFIERCLYVQDIINLTAIVNIKSVHTNTQTLKSNKWFSAPTNGLAAFYTHRVPKHNHLLLNAAEEKFKVASCQPIESSIYSLSFCSFVRMCLHCLANNWCYSRAHTLLPAIARPCPYASNQLAGKWRNRPKTKRNQK